MKKPADDLATDPLLATAPVFEGFKVLDPAVLYAKVGGGGMGAVYRGRHFSLDCDVAVKVLKAELATDEQFVLRFEREARLAARIKNENVVQVLDVRQKNGIHYLVMEFVKGETARERVQRKGKLAEAEALAILLGATRGLRAAHQEGIVHRDIKPDNVLIGADGAVKLADLGLAKQKQAAGGESLTMLASGVMGTPQYMPPEQWKSADVKPSADVWALGATLWYLLAGKSAIAGGELLDVADQIRNHDFPELAPLRPDVRPEVCALIAKCTRRDPNERFADARALLTALKPLGRDDEDVLRDAESGTGKSRAASVTPPPRSTLAKVKLQVTQGDSLATEPAGPPLSKSEEPTIPHTPPVAVRSFAWVGWLAAAVLLLAGVGYGANAGWFARADANKEVANGGGEPKVDKSAPVEDGKRGAGLVSGEDAKKAQAALVRARELLPVKGELDNAIAAFEEALRSDGQLAEAKQGLALALVRKARDLEAGDPDGAFDRVVRALDLVATVAGGEAARLRTEQALRDRLRAGLKLDEPVADAVCSAREVPVRGAMTARKLKTLRVALVPGGSQPNAPFPRTDSAAMLVVADEWEGKLSAAADGKWFVRVEAEDVHGLFAELPWRAVFVDTTPPQLTVEAPAAGTIVGARATFTGTVRDTTKAKVRVGTTTVDAGADGAWSLEVGLTDGEQAVEIVAIDAVGKEARVSRKVVVDTTPPELAVEVVLPVTKAKSVVVRGTVRDAQPVTLRADGNSVAVQRDGTFTRTIEFADEREYAVSFVAADTLGNVCAPVVVKVRYDATPPVLVWKEPAGTNVPAGDLVVSGTVADASAAAVSVNGDVADQLAGAWSKVVRVAAGQSLEVSVTATDVAGNEATPLVRTLRGQDPVGKPTWGDAAKDARQVEVDGKKYPSLVVEKQTGMRMVLIPAGEFLMGSPDGEKERENDETQHRRVIRKAFYLGETEVTQAQWKKIMKGDNPSSFKADENPVETVSWNECQQFVQKLNGGGGGFRLPSEAEWEYACRAGTTTPFSFGANITPAQANYNGNFPYDGPAKGEYRAKTVKVRSTPANAFGVFEMHGNVSEWCEDTKADYPGTGTEEATRGEGSRVLRGGSWGNGAWRCRSAHRGGFVPTSRVNSVGFRLARTLQ